MSIGNLKDSGNQGNNFPWQLKMLMGQQCACDALQEVVANTNDVESYLAQILAAIQSGADYEAALVLDNAGVTWLEIRIYNPSTGTFDPPVYYQAGSNTPGTPTAPITYINPNSYLATLVTNTTGVVRTPGMFRPNNVAGNLNSLAATFYSVSVANVGNASGTVLGATINPGEILNFSADALNNFFNSFAYNATGTEFIIIYVS